MSTRCSTRCDVQPFRALATVCDESNRVRCKFVFDLALDAAVHHCAVMFPAKTGPTFSGKQNCTVRVSEARTLPLSNRPVAESSHAMAYDSWYHRGTLLSAWPVRKCAGCQPGLFIPVAIRLKMAKFGQIRRAGAAGTGFSL